MTFAELGLRPELVLAVDRAGYTTLTPVQERAIPVVLDGRDLIACAQTGTGKTAAFLLPILHRLADARLANAKIARHPQALIVTPTRELAAQIGQMAGRYGEQLRVRPAVIFGGTGIGPQTRRMAGGVDLLVATPGRLLDHLGRRSVELGQVKVVVLDEADRMLDMGFLPDVRRILAALPVERQNLFFSATMPDQVEDLIRRTARSPVIIDVARRATPACTIRQVVHPVATARKRDLLQVLLQGPSIGQTLVFTRTRARANQLVRHLERTGCHVAAIHANKSQSARTRALHGFRTGEITTLVATDIAARGLDVDGISHVINFDLPHVPEDYVHRIGRTARAGRTGDAITLVAPEEGARLQAIERLIGAKIRREHVADFAVPADTPGQVPRRPALADTARARRCRRRPGAVAAGRGHPSHQTTDRRTGPPGGGRARAQGTGVGSHNRLARDWTARNGRN